MRVTPRRLCLPCGQMGYSLPNTLIAAHGKVRGVPQGRAARGFFDSAQNAACSSASLVIVPSATLARLMNIKRRGGLRVTGSFGHGGSVAAVAGLVSNNKNR